MSLHLLPSGKATCGSKSAKSNLLEQLVTTTYFAPIPILAAYVQGATLVDAAEKFQKQSYRSRVKIVGPQGIQQLSVPVEKNNGGILDVGVSYAENWSKDHLGAISTAYGNAPYFDVLFPDVEELLTKEYGSLWELNSATIDLFHYWLDLPTTHSPLNDFAREWPDMVDLRWVQPKHKGTLPNAAPYHQVWQSKYGFQSNLSALDLFFNLGRESWDYLMAYPLAQLRP